MTPRLRLFRVSLPAIIGALLVAGILFMNARDRARIQSTFSAPDLEQVKTALDAYLRANGGTYPPRLDVLADSHLVPDGGMLAGMSFPAAGRRHADLQPSDHVVIQPRPTPSENTPPRFALRADGRVEYARE